MENGLVQVGQSLNPLNEIKPVQAVIDEIMDETRQKLQNAAKLLG